MEYSKTETLTERSTVERGLAVVGFIALIAFGIWLAVYSSQFVPSAVNRLGAAAVALSSIFVPGDATLSVVPTASTTPTSIDETPVTPAPEEPIKPPVAVAPIAPTPGPKTAATFPIATGTTATVPSGTPVLSGLPDLTTTILATGYLATSSTDSFVASSTIPAGMRAAVQFSIKNIGTNVVESGWHFSASIPTQGAYVFYSPAEQALNPGDSIQFILGFDQAAPGSGRSISIVADSDQRVTESIEGNNSASATVDIRGY